MLPSFSLIAFADPAKARSNLSRLVQQLPLELHFPLASLLSASPDPDGALNLLERYASRAPAELLSEMARFPTALTYLTAIFGYGSSLAEAFLSHPGLPLQFARDRNFTKVESRDDLMQDYARFSTASPDPWISAQLASFKHRMYLRIVLKDVLGISTLAETTLELSELADVIAANALAYCDQELRKRYGEPQYRDAQGRIVRSEFSIIALGKMGGNELNYSSDVDLLFIYSHDGETSGGNEPDSVISNKEYFVRLANAVTHTLTQSTPFGQVFRVDLRLRPEGEMGDATISLKSALEYYEHRARGWELQMLIKARHSAGDGELTRAFLRGVEMYVYSSPTDFAAIETVLRARANISKKLKGRREETADVKLHRGGIRDIEFLTQCLQRLHGGRDPWVRSGGTLQALRKLNDKSWISDRDYAALTSAYEFLRRIEHRIQLDLGQQSHRLQQDPDALDKLARRVGVDAAKNPASSSPSSDRVRPGAALLAELEKSFQRVDEIYQRVVHPRAVMVSGNDYSLRPPAALTADQAAPSVDAAMGFLTFHAPELAESIHHATIPRRARQQAARILGQLFGSADLFQGACENPGKLARALEVIGASEYLADMLIHHPEDMMILDSTPASPDEPAAQLEIGLGNLLDGGAPPALNDTSALPWISAPGWGVRQHMSVLRERYRAQKLALSDRDCAGVISIFTSLTRWTSLAAESLCAAFAVACEDLKFTRGAPVETGTGEPLAAGPFAILALGRMGMGEFDLGSDADVIFVAHARATPQEIELRTRLAEKTIEILSSYTRDGTVFPVDTRLRPLGQEGELGVTEYSLIAYIRQQAKVWEGLTYLKASPMAGDIEFGQKVAAEIVHQVTERFSKLPDLEGELHHMRRRLERERSTSPSNPKTAPGGYYDIDFTLGYLRFQHGINAPPGANTLEQLRAVQEAQAIRPEDAQILARGAGFLRSMDHAVRLVTGRPAEGLPEHIGHAALVEDLMRHWGMLDTVKAGQPLSSRLRDIQQEVRYVYRRLVESE